LRRDPVTERVDRFDPQSRRVRHQVPTTALGALERRPGELARAPRMRVQVLRSSIARLVKRFDHLVAHLCRRLACEGDGHDLLRRFHDLE
jgi:hypothetical protein